MDARSLWLNVMHYGQFDRMPVMCWRHKLWPETRERWLKEGLPRDVVPECALGESGEAVGEDVTKYGPHDDAFYDYFNVSAHRYAIEGLNSYLYPPFEEEVLEEADEWVVSRQHDGVIVKKWRYRSGIPQFVDFTFKNAKDWDQYKWRLQPDSARIPEDLDEQAIRARTSGAPISIDTGSMVGWIRNWMGVKNLAYLAYDDRDLLAEVVDTIANLVVWTLDQVLPKLRADIGWGWEDICFRSGPLITPAIFEEIAVPGYRKIADKLREYGVDLYAVDCDGRIDELIPHWLAGGVNVMFPLEIGVWKSEPYAFRKKYGRTLRTIGGINKLEIAKGPAAIDAEIARRLPLMREGGYVPLLDHLAIPSTSLEDYRYYLERLRELRF